MEHTLLGFIGAFMAGVGGQVGGEREYPALVPCGHPASPLGSQNLRSTSQRHRFPKTQRTIEHGLSLLLHYHVTGDYYRNSFPLVHHVQLSTRQFQGILKGEAKWVPEPESDRA